MNYKDFKIGDIIYFKLPKDEFDTEKFRNISKVIDVNENFMELETIWEDYDEDPYFEKWYFHFGCTKFYEMKKLEEYEVLKYLI